MFMFWKQSLPDLRLLACLCMHCLLLASPAWLACLAVSFCNSSTIGPLKGKVFYAKGYENWQ